eukprot:TRINITY_DN184_c0_g2_i1.p1 TRINITY_DN184_c0_g2~~TRINITY_DN184_c0_g2_i1.p1  ORF type:complete len:375 (+),score=79.17 TRINITY_DN184_c0_g2_i1:36-1127(+)
MAALCGPLSALGDGTAYNFWAMKAWGVNLGNWLVLEKWIDSSIFDKYAPRAGNEWELCVQASDPASALAEHWNSWITEADFQKLAFVKVNMVRIPVGYWAFITPDAWEPYVHNGGQVAQIERILGYCDKYGIYAIIDLHGLPGSQNGEQHSGHEGPKLFFRDYNIQRGLNTVASVVNWMNTLPNNLKARIAGIEAANEPRVYSDEEKSMIRKYYQSAYDIIAASPFKVPMVFHDAFQGLGFWNDFLPAPANAVIDLHPYFEFPPQSDTNQIIAEACSSPSAFHLPILFGEWSLASGVGKSDWWYRRMMDSQVAAYQRSWAAGALFWNIKQSTNDTWSFLDLVDEGIINSGTFSLHTNSGCSTQ